MRAKKTGLFFIILFIVTSSYAQPTYYLFLQTENKQPFSVKFNNKIFSSNNLGTITFPSLHKGLYEFTILFPNSKWPPQTFDCIIEDNDLGFLLKNFDVKGWGLLNMQSFAVIMAGEKLADEVNPTPNLTPPTQAVTTTDETSTQPPTAEPTKANTIPSPPPPKTAPLANKNSSEPTLQKPTTQTDGATITNLQTKVNNTLPQATIAANNNANTRITQLSQNLVENGIKIVYFDRQYNLNDTITVFIPTPLASSNNAPTTPSPANTPPTATTNTTSDSPPTNKQPTANPTCKTATTEDYNQLRKQIALLTEEDEMILAASKTFKKNCFTTDQVRSLSPLFLSDASKYRFFDLAYANLLDPQNFTILEKELTDKYYITRFRSIIK